MVDVADVISAVQARAEELARRPWVTAFDRFDPLLALSELAERVGSFARSARGVSPNTATLERTLLEIAAFAVDAIVRIRRGR